MRKLSQEEFEEKVYNKHNNLYDLTCAKYINRRSNVTALCTKCKKFFNIQAGSLMNGHGCKKCSYFERGKNKRYSIKTFKHKSNKIHNNYYDYSLVDFKTLSDKIQIICPKHGPIIQSAISHLHGNGCRKCYFESQKLSTKEFILRCSKIHEEKYLYDKTVYIHGDIEVEIYCKRCKKYFLQKPKSHLSGHGCWKCANCNISKGEMKIKEFIQNNYNGHIILNDRNTIFNNLTNRFLELDIYLPEIKVAIEYNGTYWHSKPDTKIKDNIKKVFCQDNNIKLFIIDDDKYMKDCNYKKNIEETILWNIQ